MAARTRASRIPLASIWVETMDVRRLSQSSRDGALAGEQARNPVARRVETPRCNKKTAVMLDSAGTAPDIGIAEFYRRSEVFHAPCARRDPAPGSRTPSHRSFRLCGSSTHSHRCADPGCG